MENVMFEKVNKVLDTLRPMLMADGGNVDLVSVEEGMVKVKLQGACGCCPMSQMTLKMGIERELKRQIPEVTQVVAV
jgi:Fe-S cluster biogenesis protein NfuA